MKRLRFAAVVAAILCSAVFPTASLADTAPSGTAPAGVTYTLDGASSSSKTALASAICAAGPDANNVIACFSTPAKFGQVSADALRSGNLPPGFGALPPSDQIPHLIEAFDRIASTNTLPAPPEVAQATAARASHQRKRHPRAHKADGTSCGDSITYVYLLTYWQSPSGYSPGYEGYTGFATWYNLGWPYDNDVSSFWNESQTWTARWHDGYNGSGSYYGNGYPCRYVADLGNATMDNGDSANNRFSSYANW